MQFTCNKCGEAWDEEPDGSEPVQCPVCGVVALQPPPKRASTPQPIPQIPVKPAQQPRPIPQPTPLQSAVTEPLTGSEPKTVVGPTTFHSAETRPATAPMTPPPARAPRPAAQATPAPINAAATLPDAGGQHTLVMGDSKETIAATPPPARTSTPAPGTPTSGGQQQGSRPRSGSTTSTSGGIAAEMEHLVGRNINGLLVDKILGVGGMGAVFLAHQVSLDRDVALKVLPSRFASNAELLARFTREALSAAQLNHHNIVQVYDVGSDADVHYISMEYVRGDSLANMTKKDGRFTIDDAAGYILQAARGLKYAHDHGIIHRDIKPGNLMVNEHGIVKIADMGLAKMRGQIEKASGQSSGAGREAALKSASSAGDLTLADIAMGTPAYMAPEQARDASSVDARADQYSLGCTLYYLSTGTTPFKGQTAAELITKHMREPLTPLEVHIKNVPPAFSAIIEKMMAKRPEDRYPTLGEAVKDLEAFLGVESDKGPYTPREQHLAVLDHELKNYYGAGSQKARKLAVAAFNFGVPLLFLIALFMGKLPLAGGIVGLGLLTMTGNFVINGIRTKDYLFRRMRAVFFGMPVTSWLKFIGATALSLAVLYMLNLLVYWVVFAAIGFGIAALYQTLVITPLRKERAVPIQRMQTTLRDLRVRGVSEEALHDFVCRFSGVDWEEFFENLFGYEQMVLARGKWAATEQVQKRHKYATWRDPVARWLDGVEESRKLAREKKQLAKVETQRLKASGVSEKEAEKQAAFEATRIMEQDVVKSFKEREKQAEELTRTLKKSRGGLGPAKLFKLARIALGTLLIVVYATRMGIAPNVDPTGMIAMMTGWSYPYGFASFLGIIAGGALVASAFSAHVINAIMIVVGGLLVLGGSTLTGLIGNPAFNDTTGFYLSALLVLLGLGLNVFAKLTGKRF